MAPLAARPPIPAPRSSDDPAGTLHALIARHARATPTAFAIGGVGQPALDYRGLATLVDETGDALRALGIARGDTVAAVLPNGPALASAFIAIACHAAFAPLNPDYRADELAFYLGDLRAKAVVVLRGSVSPVGEVARAQGVRIIELVAAADGRGFTLASAPATERALPARAEAGDVALVLHTSGTTGRPKMVPLSHANVLASAHNVSRTLALVPGDRCLNVMPLFHIHGLIAGLAASLAAGAGVIATPGFARAAFFDWLVTERPTWYTAVPTIHHAVLEEGAACGAVASSLRLARSSSASLPPTVMHGLERLLGVPVVEAFGMTEAAHQVASNPLPPDARKPGSVGLPAGPEVAIVDGDGRRCGPGERGEVVIRGDNVMAGYVGGPEVNATAFVDGYFRTGDEGLLDEDGYLFLTGRFKEMINRGGEKIAPREIDELLLQHPAVAQAVTFAVPHPTMGEDVAAAVVLRPAATTTARELIASLQGKVADFKLPQQIVIVDEIPRGPSGKLQRIGLAEKLASQLAGDHVAPRTDLERALARIWGEVLRLERVSVTDNFFALGGDSLSATVVAQQAATLGVDVRTVFEHGTIEAIAAAHEQRTNVPVAEPLPALTAVAEPAPTEAARGQARRATWLLASIGVAVAAALAWMASG